jgi:hypothetical protein
MFGVFDFSFSITGIFFSFLCRFLSLFIVFCRAEEVKLKKYMYLKIIISLGIYHIEIQKDTYIILKILLSKDTKYRFVSLFTSYRIES